ncbi:MAG: Eco57I restriction-modification methylase domain-containing protein [Dysgonomonas sp.]|nr:Eco57I restriction-modification methylase domain-containing protein [Dysgonomonas sp.]
MIITNINEWFVFDAQDFEKLFYQNKTLLKHFKQFENKTLSGTSTDFFYKDIASPEIEKIKSEIPYIYFDIRDYNSILRNKDKEDDKKLIALYKFLSPTHLLKLPFVNDYNQLNKEFYAELLHILGLEEVKQKSQKFIVRKPAGKRDNGSIIENAINELDSMDKLSRLPNISQYGNSYEERLFNVALDLSITWINRVLFLKLLEAQIIKYHNGDKKYSFLSTNKIEGYDDLNSLFFQILARKEEERREGYLKDKFSQVPYLNSSLFEQTELEAYTLVISNLRDKARINLYSKSILKSKDIEIKELNPLDYLLKFLDAYDFSSEGSEDIQEENKALISASVLGLIFEKINGYKDGSFFTPSFITMFMCRDTITRTVLQKFNEIKRWECKTIIDLHNKISDIQEANQIFNSIRLCDPAVGSGHFLVSSLNEMIYLKSELGILVDKEGKRLKDYRISIENDELIISDNEFGIFKYNPHNHESQRIQETLFHEKQTIIENCLFGVDVNPNSVKICQLRLWIELLKHTYYISKTNHLETLPNIDINIKCGNSLVSRFSLDEDLKPILRGLNISILEYKDAVSEYRNAHNKQDKKRLEQFIQEIKTNLKTEISRNDKNSKALLKAQKELSALTAPSLFELSSKEQKVLQKKIADTQKVVNKYKTIIDEIKNNKIYQNAFEWRIEFPEVLSDDGVFIGFDAIIGNPPYIQLQSMGEITDVYKQMNYQTFERTGDIYCLFYELGNDLLRPNYFLSFITSNKWMRAGYGQSMRRYFAENINPVLLVDFAGINVFDEATVDVNILIYQKDKNRQQTQACIVKKEGIKDLSVFIRQNSTVCSFDAESWVILSPIEQSIRAKIEAFGTPLRDWNINIYRGVLTGYNEAFIIDNITKERLIREDSKSAEIIRPILRGRDIQKYGYKFADLWLINAHNGIKEKGINPIFIEDYPAIKNHLDKFYSELEKRQDKGNTPYNLRNCAYIEDFYKQKIIWGEISDKSKFALDEEGFFPEATSFLMVGDKLKYILAILNSKLGEWVFNQIGTTTGVGTNRWKKYTLEKLSVKIPTESELIHIEEIIDNIIKTNSIDEIKKLDKIIYQLYELSQEEVEFIENL